jgi:hypothetical protein
MTPQERTCLITGWMRERIQQGDGTLEARSYALQQLALMEERQAEALRQTFIRMMNLTFAGYGICPGCTQKQQVFSRRRATPGSGKERCLDCWRTER